VSIVAKGSPARSEARLWTRYRVARDPAARAQLVEQHLGLVRYVVRGMVPRIAQLEAADLESAGTLGLLRALDKFDPSRGLAFSTYAVHRIRGAILDDLRARDPAPRSTRRNARRLAAATSRLEQRLGRPPAPLQVAEALGIDLSTLWRWQAALPPTCTLSLDDAMGSAQFEAAVGTPAPQGDPLEAEQTACLEAAIARLPERERAVVVLSFYERLTLREIGRRLEVSESRISQIRSHALRRLRDWLLTDQVRSRGAA
jgi:RNA polymerase sigma factor for flagellar operon FliA